MRNTWLAALWLVTLGRPSAPRTLEQVTLGRPAAPRTLEQVTRTWPHRHLPVLRLPGKDGASPWWVSRCPSSAHL